MTTLSPRPLSITALNVSAPTRERATGLLELLWPDEADVWVLTETSGGEGTRLIAQVCRAAGHEVLVTDRAAADGRGVTVVGRTVDVAPEELPGPEVLPGRVLPVRVAAGEAGWGEGLRLLGVYGAASDPVRHSSAAQRTRKRAWIASFDAWLPRWAETEPGLPRTLLGDLNLADPVREDRLPFVLPEETALLAALEERHGLVDAWRAAHPGAAGVSWVDHSGAGCRYDHAFTTPDLQVLSCELDQRTRLSGHTDHAAILLALAP